MFQHFMFFIYLLFNFSLSLAHYTLVFCNFSFTAKSFLTANGKNDKSFDHNIEWMERMFDSRSWKKKFAFSRLNDIWCAWVWRDAGGGISKKRRGKERLAAKSTTGTWWHRTKVYRSMSFVGIFHSPTLCGTSTAEYGKCDLWMK